MNAAEQLLVQIGFARASTNAIAKRAGVSVGSLYQYFDNKEEVFRALVARHKSEMIPLISSALAEMSRPESNLVEVTLSLLRQMANVNARNPRLMAAIEGELGSFERNATEEMVVLEHARAVVAARTRLPDTQSAVVVQLIVTTVTHLSRWLVHRRPDKFDNELFIRAIGRMLEALLNSMDPCITGSPK